MFQKTKLFIASLAVVLISGCASVPMASLEKDNQAKAFATKSDKANIYVYRNESLGAAIKMKVNVDGNLVGETAAKTYLVAEVNPGKHSITSNSENDSALEINAEAGKNYFVWQEVKLGIMSARSKLQLVDDATGRAGIAECKLIEIAAK